ncbi:MAG: flagellar hook-length control protein FliK [Pseudomonadota bacterium]
MDAIHINLEKLIGPSSNRSGPSQDLDDAAVGLFDDLLQRSLSAGRDVPRSDSLFTAPNRQETYDPIPEERSAPDRSDDYYSDDFRPQRPDRSEDLYLDDRPERSEAFRQAPRDFIADENPAANQNDHSPGMAAAAQPRSTRTENNSTNTDNQSNGQASERAADADPPHAGPSLDTSSVSGASSNPNIATNPSGATDLSGAASVASVVAATPIPTPGTGQGASNTGTGNGTAFQQSAPNPTADAASPVQASTPPQGLSQAKAADGKVAPGTGSASSPSPSSNIVQSPQVSVQQTTLHSQPTGNLTAAAVNTAAQQGDTLSADVSTPVIATENPGQAKAGEVKNPMIANKADTPLSLAQQGGAKNGGSQTGGDGQPRHNQLNAAAANQTTAQATSGSNGSGVQLTAGTAAEAAGPTSNQSSFAQTLGSTNSLSTLNTANGSTAGSSAGDAQRATLPNLPANDQVAVQIQKAAAAGTDRISIQLHPAELGRIDVKMELGDDGLLRAMISAEKPETLELLQRDSRGLEKALQEAGLKTDSQSLAFAKHGNGGQRGEQSGSQAHGQPDNGFTDDWASGDKDGDLPQRQHDGQLDISV